MSGTAEMISRELRALRKGRGIHAARLDQRLGPNVRELVATAGSATSASLRQALIVELTSCAGRLADDMRAAITASLGLSGPTRQMRLFGDRIAWLAAQLGRDSRTALRRVDQAEVLLAEEIAIELGRRRGPSALYGWYLDEFRTLLRLDTPTPESHEHRRIVATRDHLAEVMAWLDVPPSTDQDPGLAVEISYGGRLVRADHPRRNRFQFMVRLPAPLRSGEAHEYGLILRIPAGQAMRPHYIFTPECRCNDFDLRIRFDQEHLPRWIRRVAGETVRMFDIAEPGADVIDIDQVGEVHVRFHNPAMYLGYGLQWEPW